MIKIRQEEPQDYDKVYALVEAAFKNAEHTDGDEQNLVVRLRKSKGFVSDLALLAELDGDPIGYVLLTKIKVNNTIQLAAAPLAVHPKFQKQGVGGQLLLAAHRVAKALGYEYIILVGHADYYPKFGYKKAKSFGIENNLGFPEENFFAINLFGHKTQINGVVEYPQEFFKE